MKIAFDTEFMEDGKTIELLSIGMVREDGAEYYAETYAAWAFKGQSNRYPSKFDPWLVENVAPGLDGRYEFAKGRLPLSREIVEFAGDSPQFWAWYADYDWVALCQLFGRMIDLPDGWPMYCRDYKQEVDLLGAPVNLDRSGEQQHNALEDARWLARQFGWV